MKRIYKNFVLFAMTLQILILIFGIVAIPVAAAEDEPPLSKPLFLKGTILVDDEPAPINTQIIAKINNDIIGSTKVDQVGRYGSEPGTQLPINCDPENYGNIIFYVNGVESMSNDMDALINAEPEDVIEFNIIATSPVESKNNDNTESGGFAASTNYQTTDDCTDVESSSESTPSSSTTSFKSDVTTQPTGDSTKEVLLESETGSSMMLLMIGIILLLGIIVTVGYKLKEN